jgi:hypothetical protein
MQHGGINIVATKSSNQSLNNLYVNRFMIADFIKWENQKERLCKLNNDRITLHTIASCEFWNVRLTYPVGSSFLLTETPYRQCF